MLFMTFSYNNNNNNCFKMSVFSAYVSASGVQYFDDAYVAGRKILGLSLY